MARWTGVAFFIFVAAAGYLAITERDAQRSAPEPVAGWKELDDCLPMQSLDGTRELIPAETGAIQVRGDKRDDEMPTGEWTFDEGSKRYLITIGAERVLYSLVRPKDSEVCILARGELASADMTASWYGRTLNDLEGDAANSEP
jgi:hypothetical protein